MAKILFVDDDDLTLKLMTQAATIGGHATVVAASDKKALKVAERELPDIIFIDLNLGGVDGIELAAQLKREPHNSETPILILSADTTKEAQERAFLAGVDRYLGKPLRLQLLLEVISEYTGK